MTTKAAVQMEGEPEKCDKRDTPTMKDLQEVFEMFDVDRNGKITAEGLALAMRTLGLNPTDAEVKDFVQQVGVDGTINFDDFSKMMQDNSSTDVEAELQEAFRAFDTDHSGTINLKELRCALTCIGEKLTEDEILEMFREADENKDGQIDYQEFVKMMS